MGCFLQLFLCRHHTLHLCTSRKMKTSSVWTPTDLSLPTSWRNVNRSPPNADAYVPQLMRCPAREQTPIIPRPPVCPPVSRSSSGGSGGGFSWPSNYGAALGQVTQRISPASSVPQPHLLLEGRKTLSPSLLFLGYFSLAPGHLLRVSLYPSSYSLS